jgi:hypothetical protein
LNTLGRADPRLTFPNRWDPGISGKYPPETDNKTVTAAQKKSSKKQRFGKKLVVAGRG